LEIHDLHDYLISAQRTISESYAQIQKRASEDPGTAGDQGEENWARLLREWLPSYFQVVTKGRILTESGWASDQVDVIVLAPSYPKILLGQKYYLAGGVVAAFECKITLVAKDVTDSLATCAELKKNLLRREGSPYKELNGAITFGLLAHSHSWKGKRSAPLKNIEKALWAADSKFVSHPRECIDFICVADLATWGLYKMTYISPKQPAYANHLAPAYGPDGCALTSYFCAAIGEERQQDYFSPLGVLLSGLYSKLAWTFLDMRNLEEYFRRVDLGGSGHGRMRPWPLSIYSESISKRVYNGSFSNIPFDEWQMHF
jgi:hypothetical protein